MLQPSLDREQTFGARVTMSINNQRTCWCNHKITGEHFCGCQRASALQILPRRLSRFDYFQSTPKYLIKKKIGCGFKTFGIRRRPHAIAARMARSLETKWGSIKHGVLNLHGLQRGRF